MEVLIHSREDPFLSRQFPGFEKVISQYGGTKAGNMAKFYAASIYLKTGDFAMIKIIDATEFDLYGEPA